MAEPTQNLKFSPDGPKQLLGKNINILDSTRIEIGKKLDKAKEDGNDQEYSALLGDLKIIENDIERFQVEYSSLQEQEEKPQKEEISKLGKELRTPYASPGPRAYSPYGLMPNAPNTTAGNVGPTKEEDTQRKREIIGQLYNAPAGNREVEQLPAGVRAGVGALPTPESELEYLKRTYPDSNIAPISVGGNTEYLIKNQDGTSFTTLDKGVAGTAGMLAVEAPLAVAEIGATLGTLSATKSPVLATLAGGSTRATLGPVADSITRAALGMPQNVVESIGRRGLEAAIGTALGLGTDVAIPAYRAARIPNPFENKFVQVLDESAGRLVAREKNLAAKQGRVAGEINVPVGARLAGPRGLSMESELAGTYGGSGIATAMRNTQETLIRLNTDMMSNIPATASDFAAIAINQEGQRRALTNSIARTNNKNTALIDDATSKILKPRAKENVDNLGKFFRNTIESAENQAIKSTTAQYDVLADVADASGFKVSARRLLDVLPRLKGKVNFAGAFDESAVNGVEARLKAIARDEDRLKQLQAYVDEATNPTPSKYVFIAKDQEAVDKAIKEISDIKKADELDFRSFDAWIRAFNDARPDGGAVGGTTKDVFGVGVSAELSALRRKIYGQFDATLPDGTVGNLGDEFQKATELVQARGAFERNTLGGILKEVVGEQATTPRDIVSSVMKEPFTIDRVLRAAKELELADPTQAGIANKMQEAMRLQYLNDLGMGSQKGVARLDYDQGMLDSLYGDKSNLAAKGLDSLNNKLKALKSANVPEMTLTDLNAFSSALSQDARDEVASGIIKRTALEKQEQELVRSSIFKAAQKGDFKNVDADLLSKSILSKGTTIAEVKLTMVKLGQSSPESRNLFKGDLMRNLIDNYPGGEATANAPFMPLFDTRKFLSDYETSPGVISLLGKKLELVLGEEQAKAIADIARLNNANVITDTSTSGFAPRLTATNNTVILGIPFGQLGSSVKNRYITAMLSSGSQRNALTRALSRNAMPGAVNKAYNDMAKEMFLTRAGLTALAHQASSDPEFSAELTNAAKKFKEKEGLQPE